MAMCAAAFIHEDTQKEQYVHVIGDVDERNVAELDDLLDRVLPLGAPLTIDLTQCRSIAQTAVGTLVRARDNTRSPFTTVVHGGSTPARVLKVARLEERLGVCRVVQSRKTTLAGQNVRVVALSGEWDISRGVELRAHLDRAVEHALVVLDMSGVTYIDSNCVGMLVRMRTQRVAKGYAPAGIVLKNADVRRVIRTLAFDELWNTYETLDEALEDL